MSENCFYESFFLQSRRVRLCMSETLTANVGCNNPSFEWSPGLETTDEIPLEAELDVSVDVDCPDCGDSDTASYCFPIIRSSCAEVGIEPTLFVVCEDGGPNGTDNQVVFYTQHTCSGDAIDWTTLEFDYSNTPSGITLSYGGSPGAVQCSVDFSLITLGVYYVAARVYTVGGIPSNWSLVRVLVGPDGLYIASSSDISKLDAGITGDCCNV